MSITTPRTIDELLDYWPGNIPFKGKLVSEDGSCMCAQGQALHFLGGLTVNELRKIDQPIADKQVAKLFGISLAHSVLLRIVNDGQAGAPSCVIRNPEQVLGDQAHVVLAFWRHLDQMDPAAWAQASASAQAPAWALAWPQSGAQARLAALAAARERVWAGTREAAREGVWAAAWASNEIQGAAFMRANNQPFVFLPMFGFPTPEAVIAAEQEANR